MCSRHNSSRFFVGLGISIAYSLLCGCKAADEAAAFLQHTFVVAGCVVGAVILLMVFGTWCEKQEQVHKRKLKEAPGKYNTLADQIKTWLPECRFILLEESRSGNAYAEGSDCFRARDKSIAILNAALEQIDILWKEDIRRDLYVAKMRLAHLHNCCVGCVEANKGKKDALCLALSQHAEDSEADLTFQLKLPK